MIEHPVLKKKKKKEKCKENGKCKESLLHPVTHTYIYIYIKRERERGRRYFFSIKILHIKKTIKKYIKK